MKSVKSWNIVVVLPTRDEEANLESVVAGLRGAFARKGLKAPRVLIADDSRDGTRRLARRLGVHVVVGGGKGLGQAMHRGLKAALAFKPDAVVSMDGDGQSDPSEVPDFLAPLAAGEADMVVGSRFKAPGLVGYRYPLFNRFGIWLLTRILRSITRLPLTDSHGGLRALRPEVIRLMDIIGSHTYVQETIIDACEKGFRVKEIASRWRPRSSGSTKVVSSVSTYVMYTLPALIMRSRNHVRWTYSGAGLLLAAAAVYFLAVMWQEGFELARTFQRLPALVFICLLAMLGMQLFTLGFLAELVGLIKLRVDQLSREGAEPPELG